MILDLADVCVCGDDFGRQILGLWVCTGKHVYHHGLDQENGLTHCKGLLAGKNAVDPQCAKRHRFHPVLIKLVMFNFSCFAKV